MKIFRIFFILLLLGVSASGFSQNLNQSTVADAEKQTIELTINNEKYNIPHSKLNTHVDVFSIIGTKVASIEVKSGVGEATATLPQGYYIIKADNTSRKIAVK